MSRENRHSRPVQHFSDEYLQRCRELSPDDIARFLENFKRIHGTANSRSRLISLKVPEALLAAFKTQARLRGIPYQTQIKNLMRLWLVPPEAPQRKAGEPR
ncbi:MAG: hypothetical protein F4X98_19810 [Gammaproteobacteria bacterium]|nr:hypothetical protein [Gammaproteobacteria bacterium]